MSFNISKQSTKSKARLGVLETPHGKINTPVFMPVGTLGSVKSVSPDELKDLGSEIILGNTYHLYLRPNDKFINKEFGGLHNFIKWDKPILTDSGGYQVFSLGENYENFKSRISNDKQVLNSKFKFEIFNQTQNSKFKNKFTIKNLKSNLVKILDDGVEFKSHIDGSKHFFTPEGVIDIQRNLGSDIMMVLDVCTEFPATRQRALETMNLTHKWAKKAADYWEKLQITNYKLSLDRLETPAGQINHKSKIVNHKSLLFGIVQGSTYKDLRQESAKYISGLPFDGIAVGGVSVGEGKKHMYDVMKWVGPLLPKDKPHYLMGIGEPEDIVEAIKNGFDMFDCVLPTRLGRHGVVWTGKTKNLKFKTKNYGKFFTKLDLRKATYRADKWPIEEGCQCYACKNGFSRAYLGHLIKEKEILGIRLTSMHNIHFIITLVKEIRQQIKDGKF
ncbi:MAG: hypothetical protein ACD_58C00342G0001 [uncultured bacterium]|nr:MAG: hypothetical protein ACD_58C00342G0001 [uncultured bacterium]